MKKIISLLLGSIVAFTLSASVAYSAANQVRVAFFLEWALPNQEDKVKATIAPKNKLIIFFIIFLSIIIKLKVRIKNEKPR